MSNQNNQGGESSPQNKPQQTGTKDQQSQQRQASQRSGDGPGETETGAEDETAKE